MSRLAALAWLLCGVLIGATLAYAVEVPSRSTTTYPFKWGSVDTMKESKDKEASSLTAAQIASDVNLAARLNTSHISVDTHMEYPAVMGQWVAAVRHTGKKVWFRMGTKTCSEDRTLYLQNMQALIEQNPSFWKSGDIFDGDAEADQSCYWVNACGSIYTAPCPAQWNSFVQNLTTYAQAAFAAIGVKGVRYWIHSMAHDRIDNLLTAQTLAVDHNVLTDDEYPDQAQTDPNVAAQKWQARLTAMHSEWPGATIVIGEFGFDLKSDVADSLQASVIAAEGRVFTADALVKGTNYWVGAGSCSVGGCTHIFAGSTGSWTARPGALALAGFYNCARNGIGC